MISHEPLPQVTESLQAILPLGTNRVPKATVSETIYPNDYGRVKFLGTWWSAVCKQNVLLTPGTKVLVVDREGLTLIVEPVSSVTSLSS